MKKKKKKNKIIFEEGDIVFIESFDIYGEIIEKLSKLKYKVITEKYLFILTKDEMEKRDSMPEKKGGYKHREKYPNFNNQIDIHGFNTIEAEIAVKELMYEAVQFQMRVIYIIHGKGTGVLQKTVHNLLRDYQKKNEVLSYEFAGVFDGGHGVTIVHLNDIKF